MGGKHKDGYMKAYWESQKKERVCIICGKKYKSVRESQTCSPACRGELKTRNHSKLLSCLVCRKEFKREAFHIKNGRDKTCSTRCAGIYRGRNQSGENHWNYIGEERLIVDTCSVCGKEFKKQLDNRPERTQHTCSNECKYIYMRKFSGENSPTWRGGHKGDRGANWSRQKRLAKKRDYYVCQQCGKTEEEELKERGMQLAVHHKIPYRFFGSDYKNANSLKNLVTLCGNCHPSQDSHRWEELPIEPSAFQEEVLFRR